MCVAGRLRPCSSGYPWYLHSATFLLGKRFLLVADPELMKREFIFFRSKAGSPVKWVWGEQHSFCETRSSFGEGIINRCWAEMESAFLRNSGMCGSSPRHKLGGRPQGYREMVLFRGVVSLAQFTAPAIALWTEVPGPFPCPGASQGCAPRVASGGVALASC